MALADRSVMPGSDDKKFLRQAIALSEAAVMRGGRPFGALVTDGEGRVVAQAQAVPSVDPRDWTAHSEMQALRAPFRRAAGIDMRCEEIFARCDRRVQVIGPLLEDEGLPVHRRFWSDAREDV